MLRSSPGSLIDQSTPSPQVPSMYRDDEVFGRQMQPLSQYERIQPPAPLTEFQKFVASATGQVLPIFGSDLFRRVPSTFAPVDLAPVPASYVVGPGDELRIRVWGQVSFQANVRVDRSGDIFLPRIGQTHVAGTTFAELQGRLRDAVGRVFKNFELSVDLGQIRAIQVYVSGQAQQPGLYTVSALSTLVDALFASGGPSPQGSLRNIQLRRDGRPTSSFDLYDLLANGDKTKDVKLLSGDVIFIPQVGPQVAVTGSVRSERIYELKQAETLSELLRDAGGLSAVAANADVSIGRVMAHQDMRTLNVKLDASGLATPLADGDLVHIYSIVPRFRETVTLRGNTANPGKFAWHEGMRISELLPDKEALLTRQYWWRRAQLGIPTPEFDPYLGPSRNQQTDGSTYDNGQMYPRDGQQRMPQQPRAGTATLASGEESDQGGWNQPRDREQRDDGSQPPKNDVRILAPEIDWDYAVIERQDRETLKVQLLPFDLGKLVLKHDASQDLELQPGDVVSIFSEADIRPPLAKQSKLIKLNGEFAHAGSYTAEPGDTLRDVVKRAGGLTGDAYLYGAEFRRESTRRIQQAHLDEYVRNLQLQSQRNNLNAAGSALASQQAFANNPAALETQNALIAQLNQMRATGRIVLEFKPVSRSLDDIPNIPLENGDSFTVPSHPSSVNVLGAVNDQNSFVYNPRRRVRDYLRLAGGPNRNADARHAFVIRADGSVISKEHSTGMWTGSFDDIHLNPGDTIVVPEKMFKVSALRGVLDWSQMFSQFAVGAASLNAIK